MLTFVPTPIGNPQDITIRALKVFEQATLFLCEDTRETKRLLAILEERFNFVAPKADFLSFHEHNGAKRLMQVASQLSKEFVVYVSDAGMPVISDPGQILVAYCQEQGIEYDVLPGASAVVTAYAASGFEEGAFTFWGFLPHKGLERKRILHQVMSSSLNAVLYESPYRVAKLIEEINMLDSKRRVFCAKELTKKFQSYYFGTAEELIGVFQSINTKGEWVVIVQGKANENKSLSLNEILILDIPPKIKAKLLAKITDKTAKEWYQEIIST